MATVNTPIIQQMYVAYFNRPADFSGLANWEAYAVGKTAAQLKSAISTEFAKSAEYTIVFAGMTTSQIVTKVYNNLLNRDPDAPGLQNWVNHLADGSSTVSSLVTDIIRDAGAGDVDTITNKVKAAQSFTDALDTVPEINGYSGAAANAVAATWLKTVGATAQSLTDATTTTALNTVTANVVSNSGANIGTTFTLTTGVDSLNGTANNDTIIADNTGTAKQLTTADQINGGAGTDTLKIYNAVGDAIDTLSLGTLSNVENLYLNNGALTTAKTLDVSGVTGLTSVAIDSPAAMADTASFTVKTAAGQSVSLTKVVGTAAGATSTVALNGASNVTLNGVGTDLTLDLASTGTSLNVTTTGAASTIVLTNTGAALATLNIAGDKALTITESLASVKTINASTATGAVTADVSGITTLNAAFAFTGGSGNDKLTLKSGALAQVTAGSQLDAGAGTDTLVVNDIAFATTDYAKLNAVKGFEILGLGTTAATIDASQLTSIKEFAVSAAATTINNVGAGGIIDITGAIATSVTLSAAVGNSAATVNVGTATTTGFTVAALTTTGLTNLAVTSNGTNAAANAITALSNSDNSLITVTGSNDLTFTLATASTTGSKVDGSAFTGKLNVTGSGKSDVLIGGSAADTFAVKTGSSTVTTGAGADTINVTLAVTGAVSSAAYNLTTVTDFTKGDILSFGTAAAFTNAKLDVSGAGTLAAALDLAAVGTATTGAVKWFQYSGNTYIVDDLSAGTAMTATDIVVKLTGLVDLSTSALATNALTFA